MRSRRIRLILLVMLAVCVLVGAVALVLMARQTLAQNESPTLGSDTPTVTEVVALVTEENLPITTESLAPVVSLAVPEEPVVAPPIPGVVGRSLLVIVPFANLFEQPSTESGVQAYLKLDDSVIILGRSDPRKGNWLYVEFESDTGPLDGYLHRSCTNWDTSWSWDGLPQIDDQVASGLPVDDPEPPAPDEHPTSMVTIAPLHIRDYYHLEGTYQCHYDIWTVDLYIHPVGGEGPYTYTITGTIGGLLVIEHRGPLTITVTGGSAALIPTVRVVSVDGQSAMRNDLYIPPPNCP